MPLLYLLCKTIYNRLPYYLITIIYNIGIVTKGYFATLFVTYDKLQYVTLLRFLKQ